MFRKMGVFRIENLKKFNRYQLSVVAYLAANVIGSLFYVTLGHNQVTKSMSVVSSGCLFYLFVFGVVFNKKFWEVE